MAALPPERWQALSPYLDEALEIPRRDRHSWLSSVRSRDAALGADLERLLGHLDAAETEGFLEQDAPLAGQTAGAYRLVSLIGQGGMGDVYLAERSDGEIEQRVAIKLIRAGVDRADWRTRFQRERQLLANLDHPSIARVLDAGHTRDGRLYLVMEYVDGVPIDAAARGLDLRDQLALFLRVCDGVSHAHARLIVHRDVKPSNILVDPSGQPKLLDFGIARLLDEAGDQTLTIERLLTPQYASPEQIRGATQTTATDVYSLGAVLYKLVTGRSPHESDSKTSQPIEIATGAREIPPARRFNPALPSDIEFILRKALRHEPEARYASVEALAGDIRAFLAFRPVLARSGDRWYRTRKFLRRHRVPAAAAALALASLSTGLWVANRQRVIAERRFDQVRTLANKVLALDGVIQGLPGSTKARHEIVAMSKQYLEALDDEAQRNPDLALEIGEAYSSLARVQGVPVNPNLGQYAQAAESLRRAEVFVEGFLAASPQDARGLLVSALVAHDRMILADNDERPDEALAMAAKAAGRLDTLLALGTASTSELNDVAMILGNLALLHKNLHRFDEAIRYGRREVEVSKPLSSAGHHASAGLSIIADSLRLSGDLDGALRTIRESRATADSVPFPSEAARRSTRFNVLWREGIILGEDGEVSLGRPDEAIAVFRQALGLAEEWARIDANDAAARILLASAGRELGDLLRHRDPGQALAAYDHARLRLSEVKNNTGARRREVPLLAGSSYAARRLNRPGDAAARLDAAFRLLRETKDYPADAIEPGDAAEAALRAQADHLADTGEPARAAAMYEELVAKLTAAKAAPRLDLSHATSLSRIYDALDRLHRVNGQPEKASAVRALRLELWQHWDRKLPGNAFVRRQLDEANAAAARQSP
jgi:serine/threonine protein kinase/tetratricopeptide (TPR) repeat protein